MHHTLINIYVLELSQCCRNPLQTGIFRNFDSSFYFTISPGMIKNSAKPAYWVPDEETTGCCICQSKFGPRLPIHHCRACGQGVCQNCSPNKCSVPLRGWDYPVRVCLKCEQKELKIWASLDLTCLRFIRLLFLLLLFKRWLLNLFFCSHCRIDTCYCVLY